MDILKFVEKHLGEYKLTGKEILVKECPFCKKTDFKFQIDKNNGLFQCWHASCKDENKSFGHINKLFKQYGETNIFLNREKNKTKKVDKNFVLELTDDEMRTFGKVKSKNLLDFLSFRGIDIENLPSDAIAECKGYFAFVYKLNNKVKMIKFAKAEEKNFWQRQGGIPVLFNIDNTDKSKSLLITEGEWDALCLLGLGIKNVCSVPLGVSNLEWIENCWEELEKYPEIVLAMDTDKAGQESIQKIVKRLGIKKVKMVKSGNEKDFNDLLMAEGKETVLKHLKNIMEIKVEGLIYGEDIICDTKQVERFRSGLRGLDKELGGIRMGEFTLISGYTGAGKSTLLNQIKLESIENNYKIAVYSKEYTQPEYLMKLALQCADKENIEKYYDEFKEKNMYYPKSEFVKEFKKWLGKRFIMLDKEQNFTEKELIESMKIAYQRDGAKVFFIDNLMKIKLSFNNSKWDTQADLADALVNFAQFYNVHIFLVAHPNKPDGSKLTSYDISGASELANLAHNIMFILKLTEEEKEKLRKNGLEADSTLILKKNRLYGDTDKPILIKFNEETRRLYSTEEEKNKKYNIENVKKEIGYYDDIDFSKF